jgi:hypothetical protein
MLAEKEPVPNDPLHSESILEKFHSPVFLPAFRPNVPFHEAPAKTTIYIAFVAGFRKIKKCFETNIMHVEEIGETTRHEAVAGITVVEIEAEGLVGVCGTNGKMPEQPEIIFGIEYYARMWLKIGIDRRAFQAGLFDKHFGLGINELYIAETNTTRNEVSLAAVPIAIGSGF